MPSLIDTALDRSIALGYGKVGLAARRRLPNWPAGLPRMDGRTVLVTGAASGIGRASACGFAGLGAAVLTVGRDERRAQEASEQVTAAVPGADVRPIACDISRLSAIRELADQLHADLDRLDVLVNNAGVMPGERTRSADGYELMFASHVLAPFALTKLLADLLGAAHPGRVINVSSGGMYNQSIPAGDVQSDGASYGPKKLYARTKREEVVISEEWAERLREQNVVVHSMHPGWVDTEGVRQWMPVFRAITRPIIRDADQGADTIVWLGAAEEPARTTGGFWHDRRRRPTHYRLGASPDDDAARRELWDFCEAAVGS
ncbi:MAG TPA: SDR family NAD(P)-dependent oxidoreductase [Solirubrobacteraceae bacterium]|nr:SDR family NAD(P)-dependent oxidoreductase [Solirubrobacteraceae bacterium]